MAVEPMIQLLLYGLILLLIFSVVDYALRQAPGVPAIARTVLWIVAALVFLLMALRYIH